MFHSSVSTFFRGGERVGWPFTLVFEICREEAKATKRGMKKVIQPSILSFRPALTASAAKSKIVAKI